MTLRDTETETLPPVMREALGWVVHLTSGTATHADARAFESWRAQGPSHADAFREAVAFRRAVRTMPLAPVPDMPSNIVSFPDAAQRSMVSRRGMLASASGAIAAGGAMLMIDPPYALWPSLAELGAGERTGVGERRLLRPMAGIEVEMNGRTAVSLDTARRHATLITGEAFVSVAPDAAPFSIRAGDTNWLAKSAKFDVRASERETRIVCVSGQLSGERNDVRHRITAGQRFVATPGQAAQIATVDTSQSGSWRRGLLIFRDTPLASAIEDINRYRHGKIVLANDAVGQRLVSGMFHTAQIENAVSQIRQLLNLEIRVLVGGVIVMG